MNRFKSYLGIIFVGTFIIPGAGTVLAALGCFAHAFLCWISQPRPRKTSYPDFERMSRFERAKWQRLVDEERAKREALERREAERRRLEDARRPTPEQVKEQAFRDAKAELERKLRWAAQIDDEDLRELYAEKAQSDFRSKIMQIG